MIKVQTKKNNNNNNNKKTKQNKKQKNKNKNIFFIYVPHSLCINISLPNLVFLTIKFPGVTQMDSSKKSYKELQPFSYRLKYFFYSNDDFRVLRQQFMDRYTVNTPWQHKLSGCGFSSLSRVALGATC